jgi:ElaB/YqjD/DUF883 family membrane-anchored ribosome-binding protein
MGEGPGPVGEGLGGSDSDQLRRDIERSRQELGDTVSSLAQKADVKAQAQDKVSDIKASAQQKLAEARQTASAKAEELRGKAKEASPDSATEGTQRAVNMAQENPLPVAAAGSFVFGLLVGRLQGRRKYRKMLRAKG